jgi:hypothetical protein
MPSGRGANLSSVICHLSCGRASGESAFGESAFDLLSAHRSWHNRCCQRAQLEQLDLTWNHEAHGSFIRGECADVSLLFDSSSRRWTLRIYKRQTSFGHPVTYEIAFKERYGPTVEQAIALANNILLVELGT